jgi:hypothetical protein
MRNVLFVSLFVLLGAGVAQAQPVETIVSRDAGFFSSGQDPATGGIPFQTNNYTVAQTVCGLTPKVSTPGGVVVNPRRLRFDDPANPTTADCELNYTVIGTAIQAIPIGTGYKVALRSKGATLTSAWSALSNPFAIQAVSPDVPTGVRALP